MSEEPRDTGRARPASRSADEDVASSGDEGKRTAQSTPPIADDAAHEQTEAPAPPDDVGMSSDEDITRTEEEAEGEH